MVDSSPPMAGFSPTPRPWVPGRRPRGATFIELLALTIVILILAMIGVPRISPVVQQFRLKGAAWQLAGDLRLARQRAVTTQRRMRVCISDCGITVPAGAYSVEVEQPPPGGLNWTSETGAPVRLPPDVCIDTGKPGAVTFAPDGTASKTTTFSLYNLIGKYEVTVNTTGQVTAAPDKGNPPKCP